MRPGPSAPSSLKVNVKPTQLAPAQPFSASLTSIVARRRRRLNHHQSPPLLLSSPPPPPARHHAPRAHGFLVIFWFLHSVPFVELASQSLVSPSNRRLLFPRRCQSPTSLWSPRDILAFLDLSPHIQPRRRVHLLRFQSSPKRDVVQLSPWHCSDRQICRGEWSRLAFTSLVAIVIINTRNPLHRYFPRRLFNRLSAWRLHSNWSPVGRGAGAMVDRTSV